MTIIVVSIFIFLKFLNVLHGFHCVGYFNQKYFLLFLFYLTIGCFYACSMCISILLKFKFEEVKKQIFY